MKRNLASPLFTADLHKGRAGSYDFGFIDDAKYTGRITYVPVDSTQGFWGFSSNGYAIGGNAFTTTSIKAIMDTGTTLLLLPDAIVSAYYSKVQGATYNSYQGGFTFPCSVSLPSITLGIGDYKAVVPGSYMIYAPLGGGSTSEWPKLVGLRWCYGWLVLTKNRRLFWWHPAKYRHSVRDFWRCLHQIAIHSLQLGGSTPWGRNKEALRLKRSCSMVVILSTHRPVTASCEVNAIC